MVRGRGAHSTPIPQKRDSGRACFQQSMVYHGREWRREGNTGRGGGGELLPTRRGLGPDGGAASPERAGVGFEETAPMALYRVERGIEERLIYHCGCWLALVDQALRSRKPLNMTSIGRYGALMTDERTYYTFCVVLDTTPVSRLHL